MEEVYLVARTAFQSTLNFDSRKKERKSFVTALRLSSEDEHPAVDQFISFIINRNDHKVTTNIQIVIFFFFECQRASI